MGTSTSSRPRRRVPGAVPARKAAVMAARALDGAKGTDVVVLDVTGVSPITDFLVVATGGNPRHVKAVADEAERVLKESGIRPVSREGVEDPRWIVLDYGPLVLHLFLPDTRNFYDLEMLWGDGRKVRWRAAKKKAAARS